MFRALRLRLTFLYLLVAIAFTGLMTLGTQRLVTRYFQNSTDLALRYRMAQEFILLGLPLPPELSAAAETWGEQRGSTPTVQRVQQPPVIIREGESEHEEESDEHGLTVSEGYYERGEEAYDGDLAAIYTLPLDDRGNLEIASLSSAASLPPDAPAVASAIVSGHDLRTIDLASGTRVRLLTYAIESMGNQPAFLQLGRPLADQQRLLNQLTLAMTGMGGLILLILSFGSWWLAGRSISPAEEAWGKQQTFIANAGHELRTPLTLIRANTEVSLRNTPENDANHSRLKDVLQETVHMGKLVEDLLLLSRLDSGVVKLQMESIELESLLPALIRQSQALAAEHGVTLTLGASHGRLQADATRLRQVLLILLDNALAHTPPEGEIRFGSVVEGNHVRLSVTDSGVGIRKEHLEHVFERFYQVERNGRSSSGLGLSIAKGLTEAMGGQLELVSSDGAGTTARMTFTALP
ncbi:MAG: histidine kinase [Anaerolineales bacterium]|nr:MAG: histidine kinase [Anaerolineales bacterium]